MTAKQRLYDLLIELGLVVVEDYRRIEIEVGDGPKQHGYTGSSIEFTFDASGDTLEEMWIFQ